MQELEGYVENIIYHNVNNYYTVLSLSYDDEEIVCTGVFPSVTEGETLCVRGDYVEHPTYGRQFKVSSFEAREPDDVVAMERYLASGAIKGIGPKLANRIVKKFKADTFRIMEEEPERLSEIKGISERMAREISDQMTERKDLRDALVFLAKYNISTNMAVRIYNTYGPRVYTVVRENPYRMAEEVSGIGFKTADDIASRVGIKVDSDYRISSGVMYCLSQCASLGHTYLPKEILLDYARKLLGVSEEQIETQIMNLMIERKIIVKGNQYYSKMFYRMEDVCAGMLHELNIVFDEAPAHIQMQIAHLEQEEQITLDEIQRDAVVMAATHGLFVLTGGPGTGKTTTIRTIIGYFVHEGLDVFLAAPTGRAAKRMTETTGYEAKTLHRLLEVKGLSESEDHAYMGQFERNEKNPLEADVVIVDEVSMMDITLLYALLKAIDHGTRLILVGDENQLPSVGPGNVLRDILQSQCFSSITLQKIFRQSEMSDIVVNAHKINRGEKVILDNKSSKDFFFMRRTDANQIIREVISLVQDRMPRYVDVSPVDVQVLSPSRKGLLGVDQLNVVLQEKLNPPSPDKKEYTYMDRIFREGDKVMHVKNNYQLEWEIRSKYGIAIEKGLGVFNGDTGIIKEINLFSKRVSVLYDENRIVEYPFEGLSELELAYAITIHKSQGSEYPVVVMPLMRGPRMLMYRNLLYTAVTRAKQCFIIVGDEQTFYDMIDNTEQQKRYSGLKDRIIERADM